MLPVKSYWGQMSSRASEHRGDTCISAKISVIRVYHASQKSKEQWVSTVWPLWCKISSKPRQRSLEHHSGIIGGRLLSLKLIQIHWNWLALDVSNKHCPSSSAQNVEPTIILLILFPDMFLPHLILYLASKFLITTSFNIQYVYAAEMFPTELRLSLCGFASMFGRIGSMLAPQTLLLVWKLSKFLIWINS